MEETLVRLTPMTEAQMQALEAYIVMSPEVKTPMARKAIIWLIRQTENLSVPTQLNFGSMAKDSLGAMAAFSIHAMNSCVSKTQLRIFLDAMGLGIEYGLSGSCSSANNGYSIHFGLNMGSFGKCRMLVLDLAQIEAVDLLYIQHHHGIRAL